MIRAILLRLIGCKPVHEVRLVSLLTKRDIPGTKIYSGPSYRKARAMYNKQAANLPENHEIRLQAVVRFKEANRPEFTHTEPAESTPEALAVTVRMSDKGPQIRDNVHGDSPPDSPADIAESFRQQDAVSGDPVDEHKCNIAGEMILVDGAYRSTCSICHAPQ